MDNGNQPIGPIGSWSGSRPWRPIGDRDLNEITNRELQHRESLNNEIRERERQNSEVMPLESPDLPPIIRKAEKANSMGRRPVLNKAEKATDRLMRKIDKQHSNQGKDVKKFRIGTAKNSSLGEIKQIYQGQETQTNLVPHRSLYSDAAIGLLILLCSLGSIKAFLFFFFKSNKIK